MRARVAFGKLNLFNRNLKGENKELASLLDYLDREQSFWILHTSLATYLWRNSFTHLPLNSQLSVGSNKEPHGKEFLPLEMVFLQKGKSSCYERTLRHLCERILGHLNNTNIEIFVWSVGLFFQIATFKDEIFSSFVDNDLAAVIVRNLRTFSIMIFHFVIADIKIS